jgi:hypothetical protein
LDKSSLQDIRSIQGAGRPDGAATRPVWLDDAVEAVTAELRAAERKRPTQLGWAKRQQEGTTPLHARFEVDVREQGGLDLDRFDELKLRAADGSTFPVLEVLVQEPDRLVVLASARATGELMLLASRDPRFILERLCERLEVLTEPGLAAALAGGSPTTTRVGSLAEQRWTGTAALRLDDAAQQEAFAATLAPGLNAVWGPPGTGKPQVLAAVLVQLVREGRSALLVSNTNVAVDQALMKAAQVAGVLPGQMVRVGTPSVLGVADSPLLPLERACELRARGHHQRRRQIQQEAARLQDESALRELARVQEVLAEHPFDKAAHRDAQRRLRNRELLHEAQERLAAQAEALAAARREHDNAQAALVAAEKAVAEVALAADAYRRIGQLLAEVARRHDDVLRCSRELTEAEGQLEVAQRQLDELRARPLLRRLWAGGERRSSQEQRRCWQATVEGHRQRLWRCQRLYQDAQQHADRRVPQLQVQAEPYDLAAVEKRHTQERDASDRLERAVTNLNEQHAAHEAAKGEVVKARASPQPRGEDARLVEEADRLRLPALAASVVELTASARPLLRQLEKLAAEDKELRAKIKEVEAEVIESAGVVATTLAQVVLNERVYKRHYDYVLVDEAAFALPPYVVLAASRAGIGVTLFGDYLQNGPISNVVSNEGKEGEQVPEAVRRWLAQDCFALLGLDDPVVARQQAPGCTVLTRQHRFGPVINELANRVAYKGLLEVAGGGEPVADEVVLVDVAGLADQPQRDPRTGKLGFWMVGALVARALAAQHDRAGESVGVIVPYRAQQQLTQTLVLEAGLSHGVVVGTSHRFQGQEFDVVVFDLVEHVPGGAVQPGWVARGRLSEDPYELGGLRLFNVGATRPRRRLYVIADGTALAKTTQGPLAALRAMVLAGQVRVLDTKRSFVRAARYQARARDAGRGVARPSEGEVVGTEVGAERAVAEAAMGLTLYGAEELYRDLPRILGPVTRSVWLWSPFAAKRAAEVLPHLYEHAAANRRVTLFVKPSIEINGCPRAILDEARQNGVHAVEIMRMHQKILVMDERWTLMGSLNLLSHSKDRPSEEVMVLIESVRFARQVLDHEGAEGFVHRFPRCPHHHGWAYAVRAKPKDTKAHGTKPRWLWRCSERACRWEQPLRFPKARTR